MHGALVRIDGRLDTAGNTHQSAYPCPLKPGGHRIVRLLHDTQAPRDKVEISLLSKAKPRTGTPSHLLSIWVNVVTGQPTGKGRSVKALVVILIHCNNPNQSCILSNHDLLIIEYWKFKTSGEEKFI